MIHRWLQSVMRLPRGRDEDAPTERGCPTSSASVEAVAVILTAQLASLRQSAALVSNVFASQLHLRLIDVSQQLDLLARGCLRFDSTETWHCVYRAVLDSVAVRRYFSVALIRSDDYWRDPPAEQSLRFNADLVKHGFLVHRAFLIDEFFWPRLSATPSTALLNWIAQQREDGIVVSLVRLSDLEQEKQLVCDMGLYGTEAVGYQQTDFDGRTTRFELWFDTTKVQQAERRWRELSLFAKPWDSLFM